MSASNGRHSGDVNFVSNGSRNATSDVLMDGVSVTNYEQNSGTLVSTYMPTTDAVEKFKAQTSNFSAEFGFSGATIVNVVTRSGTNQFHGSGYEYLRNQVLAANSFFDNAQGNKLAGLRRNNFGGIIGGPIKRNKTFEDGWRRRHLLFPLHRVRGKEWSRFSTYRRKQPRHELYPSVSGNAGDYQGMGTTGRCHP